MIESLNLRNLRNEVDNLFDRFVERPLGVITGQVVPVIDLYETDTDLVVRADLPGVTERDLDVSLSGQTLTLRGEKPSDRNAQGRTFHVAERSCGAFSRTVRLPVEVDAERIRASYRQGVLEVVLPKKRSAQATRINIQVEGEPGPAPRP